MGFATNQPPRTQAGAIGLALIVWGLAVAAKADAAPPSDDDWTMPAIIVGVMVFLFLNNLIFGTGKKNDSGGICGGGGDSCGGGCGGGD